MCVTIEIYAKRRKFLFVCLFESSRELLSSDFSCLTDRKLCKSFWSDWSCLTSRIFYWVRDRLLIYPRITWFHVHWQLVVVVDIREWKFYLVIYHLMMMRSEGYSFFVWSGNNLILSMMSFTSCFSGQVSRGSGEIAVEITCIESACVRVHVESKDSGGGGITVAIVSVLRLETSVSIGPWVTLAPFRALMSRGDSFWREAPSFMSSWMALRHNVSTSLSLSSDLGVSLRLIWIISNYERLLCLYYKAAHLLSKLWKTQHVWSCQLYTLDG